MDRISLSTSRFFETQPKIEELRALIDNPTNSEREAAEGMKFLLASISKGRDVSSLYPSVAKLVVTPNHEIKKMVYIYLVHYAEVEPEAALLAINTLKKELSNPNQLVRANALRTMSSIRVRIIAQLVGLAVKQASTDSSPYVRKAAAHAVPKLVSLDPEQEEPMLAVMETLLNDNATMVLASAVTTFNEVCPNEWGLIHRNFRKFCGLLADLDEWGQISALHMLTRYGRTQFLDPDAEREAKKARGERQKPASTEGESDESSDDEEDAFASIASAEASMDPDHRLLLRSALPLLQSRNAGVVLAVATLYHYLAPRLEQQKIAKSLIRILHTRKEARYVILNGILTLVEANPDMFRPHLSDFFVESSEPTYIRKIKIDIVTLLANEGNISRILREFKIYVSQEDKDFVKASIQAIGRCAMLLPEVTETCMHCLTSLIGTHSEAAVAEAIVVVKKLLQVAQGEHRASDKAHSGPSSSSNGTATPDGKAKSGKAKFGDIVKHMAKLLDTVQNPQARASIAWIISEHVEQLKTVAPDVLRKLAKTFPEEDQLVKLQTLNLGVKLFLTNPEQTTQLFQYVLNLAKYDTNYDLRDRARLIRRVVFNVGNKANTLHEHAEGLFLTKKPVPTMDVITPKDNEGEAFVPGTVSSLLGHTAYGYLRIPTWNTEKLTSDHRNPIKREWENFAYSAPGAGIAHTPAPITAISWDQVQHMQPVNSTSFSSTQPNTIASPGASAHSVAGYATREEYERAFWGDDSSSSSSGSSRSRSGSTSSNSSSYSSSSGSGSSSDTESETDAPAAVDDDLFDAPASSSASAPSSSADPAAAAAVDTAASSPAPAPVEVQETAASASAAPVVEDLVADANDFVPPAEASGEADWLNGGDASGETPSLI
jgi:AP-3 complex subunit beta